MRGYFGIGVDGIHKPLNVGNLLRSAHAFGASFFFTVNPALDVHDMRGSDTSGSVGSLPFYTFDKPSDLILPRGVQVVAVELLEDSVDLPSFRHPQSAVYVLGPEKGNVSDAMLARCDHKIKIPMKFCINVGVAGAIVMYDRLVNLGGFPDRPVGAFAPEKLKPSQIVNK